MDTRTHGDEAPLPPELVLAGAGVGPLYQRDYWAVIDRARLTPPEIGALLRARFPEFAPHELARFERVGDASRPLALGDALRVHIRWAGTYGVRVVHTGANSLTLGTLRGHPEAGRITFGAYRDRRGNVIFHIRSRARNGSTVRVLGFFVVGESMQTNTWCDFVDRIAHTVGDGVVGAIQLDMHEAEPEADEDHLPTYVAEGA